MKRQASKDTSKLMDYNKVGINISQFWHDQVLLLTHRKIICCRHNNFEITYRKKWPLDSANFKQNNTTNKHATHFPLHRSELIVRQRHASSVNCHLERAWSEQSIPPTGEKCANLLPVLKHLALYETYCKFCA
jgi:hypothetical protein